MAEKRQLKLGVSIRGLGYHAGGWRHPDVPSGGAMDFEHFVNVARIAEAAKLDMVFLADGVGIRQKDEPPGSLCRSNQNVELEPITLLSALAAVTKHIGLVATASTTYNEPYHLARKFGSLDHISKGRAGWNLVTSWSDAEAFNFGREHQMAYADRYERAMEFAEVVTGLWDSWEGGAFVHDKTSGVFYDPDRLHTLAHRGKHFSVLGPLSVDRTPQGRPIIVQAGASDQGRDIAARFADIVFSAEQDLAAARAYYASVKGRLATHGRRTDELLMLPGLVPIVGATRAEAQAKHEALQELIDPLVGLSYIYGNFGDLSAYPIDGPVPEPKDPKLRSRAAVMFNLAQEKGYTIRQLCQAIASGRGHRTVIGTPADIADTMEEWVDQGAADGFNIIPTHLPVGLEDFAALVLPELRRRGIFREEYEARTFRGNLGLPEPQNRYTEARGQGTALSA
ncbi:LLM class flavin-dependent oxidoreductase [Roseomonas sp. HJA6]|uniref:LLM class flavin-dependent oxidoreductase n=1 Tax=Roseomonas alba TaxID=2846776 RepID=A0ABS7AC91_9PROT|nr:LLM class flavin-dependent oxidoreductase [Neoroseomonas alba]MBW6399929.1 LLM class flavin-dependent oxidoreductase [Neoroseomonas alba]